MNFLLFLGPYTLIIVSENFFWHQLGHHMLENCHDIEIYIVYDSKHSHGATYSQNPDHTPQVLCGLDSVMKL